jgi:hypothetical protein
LDSQNTTKIPYDAKVSRTRTAAQIIEERTIMGCTDIALLFIALMRSIQVSAKYIETISERTLKEMEADTSNDEIVIYGHVFVRVQIDNLEFIVDPTACQISLRRNLPVASMFSDAVIINEGEDFDEFGLNNTKAIRERAKVFIKNEWKKISL